MVMSWIYISPHLDDAVLSCGGLIWDQNQAGDPAGIWTICAGDPPEGPFSAFARSLHERWQTGRKAVRFRRQEDIESCRRLDAAYRHFAIPDCIYRRGPDVYGNGSHLYTTEESLTGPLDPVEEALIQEIGALLRDDIPPETRVVCPLALGGHVDHKLTRAAVEQLGMSAWYYADYPYILRRPEDLPKLVPPGWRRVLNPISPPGLQAWQDSVAAHRSQISTFWPDTETMREAVVDYYRQAGGIPLWQPPG